MEPTSERKSNEAPSGGTSESTDVPHPTILRSTWSVTGVKGKMTDKCLWSACKAMTAGILLIAVGAGMATLGFYADHLSTVEETKGNTTILVKNEAKDTHLGSLTYLGPVVMGVGGFTIVAACVMTFEARDTAAKIVPIWFRRTRIHVVSGGSGSTPSGRSSKSSWERMLSQQRSSEDAADTRSAITQALINFSKYLQSNVDPAKMPTQGPITDHNVGLHKCPSEPNLTKASRKKSDPELPESATLLEASTPQPTQRTSAYGGGLKPLSGTTRPQLLAVAADTYRQAVSMDCPRPIRLQRQEAQDNQHSGTTTSIPLLIANGATIQTLILQTSCTTSSSGSMSVDIYLPQGNVTLRVHDDMKDTSKRSPLIAKDSDESRSVRFSQHSDIRSFGEEDNELVCAEVDDSVFATQDSRITAPKITFDTLDMDSEPPTNDCNIICRDNLSAPNLGTEQLSVEEWVQCPAITPSRDASIDSLEMNISHDSPQSMSSATPYSFDYSDLDSPGISIASILSNQLSSKFTEQNSFSQTGNSFMNVSSLNSLGSSQDVFSPLAFASSPRDLCEQKFFPRSDPPISDINFPREVVRALSKSRDTPDTSIDIPSESSDVFQPSDTLSKFQHASVDMGELAATTSSIDVNPRKFSSLGSAEELKDISSQFPCSQERQQYSAKTADISKVGDTSEMAKYLSPHSSSTTGYQTTSARPHSPRKTRSESLPERRSHKTSSLKRFPLLRQVALDTFAEEGGSTQRLDRAARAQKNATNEKNKPSK